MNVIECLAVLHEENVAMVKALLRPVGAAVQCATFAVGEDDDSDEKELAMTGFLPTRRDALLELEKRLKELLHVVQVEIDLDAKDDKAKPECSNTFEFYPTSLNVTKERLED